MRYTIKQDFYQTDDMADPVYGALDAAHDYLEAAVEWLQRENRIQHMTNAYQDLGDDCAIAVIELNDRDTAMLLKLSL